MKVQLSKIGVIGKSVIHMPSHGLREVYGACYASMYRYSDNAPLLCIDSLVCANTNANASLKSQRIQYPFAHHIVSNMSTLLQRHCSNDRVQCL